MNDEEVKLLDYQIIATYIYIGSLILSIYLTYNDKKSILKQKKVISEKNNNNLSIFNRIIVVTLSCVYFYINYKNFIIAKEKKEDTYPFRLQIAASEISILAALIVLYVVIYSGNYSIVASVETPSL